MKKKQTNKEEFFVNDVALLKFPGILNYNWLSSDNIKQGELTEKGLLKLTGNIYYGNKVPLAKNVKGTTCYTISDKNDFILENDGLSFLSDIYCFDEQVYYEADCFVMNDYDRLLKIGTWLFKKEDLMTNYSVTASINQVTSKFVENSDKNEWLNSPHLNYDSKDGNKLNKWVSMTKTEYGNGLKPYCPAAPIFEFDFGNNFQLSVSSINSITPLSPSFDKTSYNYFIQIGNSPNDFPIYLLNNREHNVYFDCNAGKSEIAFFIYQQSKSNILGVNKKKKDKIGTIMPSSESDSFLKNFCLVNYLESCNNFTNNKLTIDIDRIFGEGMFITDVYYYIILFFGKFISHKVQLVEFVKTIIPIDILSFLNEDLSTGKIFPKLNKNEIFVKWKNLLKKENIKGDPEILGIEYTLDKMIAHLRLYAQIIVFLTPRPVKEVDSAYPIFMQLNPNYLNYTERPINTDLELYLKSVTFFDSKISKKSDNSGYEYDITKHGTTEKLNSLFMLGLYSIMLKKDILDFGKIDEIINYLSTTETDNPEKNTMLVKQLFVEIFVRNTTYTENIFDLIMKFFERIYYGDGKFYKVFIPKSSIKFDVDKMAEISNRSRTNEDYLNLEGFNIQVTEKETEIEPIQIEPRIETKIETGTRTTIVTEEGGNNSFFVNMTNKNEEIKIDSSNRQDTQTSSFINENIELNNKVIITENPPPSSNIKSIMKKTVQLPPSSEEEEKEEREEEREEDKSINYIMDKIDVGTQDAIFFMETFEIKKKEDLDIFYTKVIEELKKIDNSSVVFFESLYTEPDYLLLSLVEEKGDIEPNVLFKKMYYYYMKKEYGMENEEEDEHSANVEDNFQPPSIVDEMGESYGYKIKALDADVQKLRKLINNNQKIDYEKLNNDPEIYVYMLSTAKCNINDAAKRILEKYPYTRKNKNKK